MDKRQNIDRMICILIGVYLAVIFQKASGSVYNAEGYFHGHNFNLLVYVGALVSAFVLFLLLVFLADKVFSAKGKASSRVPQQDSMGWFGRAVCYLLYAATAVTLFILIYQIYINENNIYPQNTGSTFLRQEVPHKYYFLAIAGITLIIFLGVSRKKQEANKRLRLGLAFLFCVLNSLMTYCPNIFEDKGAGVYHIHAVYNSIINTAHFQPFGRLNCSIYGHYSLLLLPFVKIFGNDLTAITLSLSLMNFISFAAAFYLANKLLKHDVPYFLCLAAITGTSSIFTRHGQYYQVNPLRLLFPMLILAAAGLYLSSKKTAGAGNQRLLKILPLAVGICSVIWNFETGLFTVLTWMAFMVYDSLPESPLFSKGFFKKIGEALIYMAVCMAGAYLIVNLYNLLCGGSWNSVKLFIYPLFSGTYNVNHLRAPLPSVKFLYFLEILVFFTTIIICLRRQCTQAVRNQLKGGLRFAIAVSGLLTLIYFMNRAAYTNISICHIQFCLLIASWSSPVLRISRGNIKSLLSNPIGFLRYSIAGVLFFGTVWLAVEGMLYIGPAYDFRARSVWDRTTIHEGAKTISETVPKDTFAFGLGVPEIYYILGWDTGCYVTDWADMNDYNREHAYALASQQDAVLTSNAFDDPAFDLVSTVSIGKYDFNYYVRKA